jgi:hypothetical protein
MIETDAMQRLKGPPRLSLLEAHASDASRRITRIQCTLLNPCLEQVGLAELAWGCRNPRGLLSSCNILGRQALAKTSQSQAPNNAWAQNNGIAENRIADRMPSHGIHSQTGQVLWARVPRIIGAHLSCSSKRPSIPTQYTLSGGWSFAETWQDRSERKSFLNCYSLPNAPSRKCRFAKTHGDH